MRERSGTRTEHATRRRPISVQAVLSAAVVLVTVPGLAVGTAAAAQIPAPGAPGGVATGAAPVGAGGTVSGDAAVSDTSSPRVDEVEVPRTGTTGRAAASAAEAGEPPVVARVERMSTEPFALVGLTWRDGTAPADMHVRVRTHDSAGWSEWTEMHFHPGEGPAPDEESGPTRAGTDPLWVDSADGVQAEVLSASGVAPADPELALVDPGATPAGATVGAAVTGADSDGAAAATTAFQTGSSDPNASTSASVSYRPRIVSRRQWGADRSLRSHCDSPRRARTLKMVFVHHTAGTNDYSRSEAPAIVRSIYAYHTQGQNWCDIGYNFLVDRFGTVYEGRAGGVNTPVRGAHTGDYNTLSAGVSLIGNFEKKQPSRAMKRGLTQLVSWKLSSYYRDPTSRTRLAGVRFRRISGHRDAMSTACPGRYAYAWLPKLRQRVERRVGNASSPIAAKAERLRAQGSGVGAPYRGEEASVNDGRRTEFAHGWIYWKDGLGAHPVAGRVSGRYKSLGRAGGPLGYPASDTWSIRGDHGRGQTFRNGRIFRVWGHGTAATFGRIDRRYRRLHSVRGRLGLPTNSQNRTRHGWAAGFQHGRITWNTSTGRVRVRMS